MLKGDCKDPGQVSVLTKGASYFLFPAGNTHYYASKFPNKNSHRGCFEKSIFENVKEFAPGPEVKVTIIEAAPEEGEFEQLSLF